MNRNESTQQGAFANALWGEGQRPIGRLASPHRAGEVILYQPDETVRLEVRLGDESVWLTQQQMAELFDKDRTVIGRHIHNIYKEKELDQSITCAKFAHMGSEGDLGKRLFAFELMGIDKDIILSQL